MLDFAFTKIQIGKKKLRRRKNKQHKYKRPDKSSIEVIESEYAPLFQ